MIRVEGSRRSLLVAACCVVLVTAVILPVSRYQLQPSISFMPAMLSVVACFDVISVYLLVGDYRDRGDVRLLMMAWAYGWSLVVMIGYALAFPGAIAADPPLALTPSMAPYMYIAWHGGFPLLMGAAWAPWPGRWVTPTPADRRRVVTALSMTASVVAGLALVCLVVAFGDRLPVLINGLDTRATTAITAPVIVSLVAVALAVTVHGTRRRHGPERWASIAVLVCLCDLIVTYRARTRYSMGWYSGRTLTLVAAAVLLLAMLVAFRRLKAQAEHHAAIDPLTGLCNRRSANAALDQLVARCRRSGAALGVLSLDLDHFKRVNDRYGHETGDAVLAQLGQMLTRSSRYGDVVARVGGEEFLILLPDTDEASTLIAAEKIRALVAGMTVPGTQERMTASLGATTMDEGDLTTASLLRRADAALYQAKNAGRNRVVTAGTCAAAESARQG